MIKMIALVKRRPGMSREAFVQRWVEEHTPHSLKLGMVGYRINVALEPQPDGGTPPYDGTAEIWWADEVSMRAAMASPDGVMAANDAQQFCDALELLFTEEFVVQ